MASSIGKTWAQLGHLISVGIIYSFKPQSAQSFYKAQWDSQPVGTGLSSVVRKFKQRY